MKQLSKFLYLIIFLQLSVFSQEKNESTEIGLDSIPVNQTIYPILKNKVREPSKSVLSLRNPVDYEIIYDYKLRRYIFTEKVGDYNISVPIYMTPTEYKQYRLNRSIVDYYNNKIDIIEGKSKNAKKQQRNLLPKYYRNNKFFKTIFGSSEIVAKLKVSVTLKMGILYQRIDNPQLTEDNKASTIFDFDQKISASFNVMIGTRVRVSANYDTQSTFDFQKIFKLEFLPPVLNDEFTDDSIIRKFELGNISMGVENSLITGSQSLFGLRTDLQFGKTYIKTAFSQQKSDVKTVSAKGGQVINEFEIKASNYQGNKHYFISQYFRNNFDKALENVPLINSPITITKMEVWITNRNSQTTDIRNIVALADLGESGTDIYTGLNNIQNTSIIPTDIETSFLPNNSVNSLNDLFSSPEVRNNTTMKSVLSTYNMSQGTDYASLQNAKKLQSSEYKFNPQLGYISLSTQISQSDVLAIAFEYTVAGSTKVYKVGELSTDGVAVEDNLILKLLKNEGVSTSNKIWDLMMKNIYFLNSYQISPKDFRLEVQYKDAVTGLTSNMFQNAKSPEISSNTLLNITDIDRLNQNDIETENGDGYFDFIEGLNINSNNGTIMFPSVQPFGATIKNKISNSDDYKYLFNELYSETKTNIENTFQSNDRYIIKGYLKSDNQDNISLGAFNVAPGSVTVSSGGRLLTEGVDYTVNYSIGTVEIINMDLKNSNAPIEASVESNGIINQSTKTFVGVDVKHTFTENFSLGATYLNISEKPITKKVSLGQEPVDNTVYGLNTSYRTEIPFITRLLNRFINIDTDVASVFSVNGNFAYLKPKAPTSTEQDGEATSYIDDFEGTQTPFNLMSASQWRLSSTPQHQTDIDLKNLGGDSDDLSYGYNRAKMSWYNIDRLFYEGSSKPSNIDSDEISRAEVRYILNEELFPEKDLDDTQSGLIKTLDLAYYPSERGSYNYEATSDEQGHLDNPEKRWAGITRAISTTDFERENVEYIQFWIQDPYLNYSITENEAYLGNSNINDPNNFKGEMYINLGNISEDVLKDGLKMFENGIPEDGNKTEDNIIESQYWGDIPKKQSLVYNFLEDNTARLNQDIGLDGLNDEEEALRYPNTSSLEDPSSDNYHYFRGSVMDSNNASILTRYKDFTNSQGNSPTIGLSPESYSTSSTPYPDVEDINSDQTMSTLESYYQYKISLNKDDLVLGQNYIVDEKNVNISLANGSSQTVRWLQFRVPVKNPDEAINGISGYNSIKFMRLFLTKFNIPIVIRFGQLELVKGSWRRSNNQINNSNTLESLDDIDLYNFNTGVVNLEENSLKTPIPYVLPPGIVREEVQGSTSVQTQNEQSILLRVIDLPKNEARGIYKNVNLNLRNYKKIKLFVHAESISSKPTVENNDISLILRLGDDVTENYYQVEKKLSISDFESLSADQIWPEVNNLEFVLDEFSDLKSSRISEGQASNIAYEKTIENGNIISVKGNPNLTNVKAIMLGVKNNAESQSSVEVWFNELRMAGFENQSGWATQVNTSLNFADIADVSFSGKTETIGYGSVDQSVSARNVEDIKQYSFASNFNVGKTLPKKWFLQLPVSYSISEDFAAPKYDPTYEDIEYTDAVDKDIATPNAEAHGKRHSISFNNVRKNRNPESKRTPTPIDIENFTVSYSYSKSNQTDSQKEIDMVKTLRTSANYVYKIPKLNVAPFKKVKFLSSKTFKLIRNFNFNLLPTSISSNLNINRTFSEQKNRNVIEGLSELPSLVQQNYLFDWDYRVNYPINNLLSMDFIATNNNVYDDFDLDDTIGLHDNLFEVGRLIKYNQKLKMEYKIPLRSIPFLSSISSSYNYSSDYTWKSAIKSYEKLTGNTIENGNTQGINISVNMKRLYKDFGVDALILGKTRETKSNKFRKSIYQIISSVRKVKFSYREKNGTYLPGFVHPTGFAGLYKTGAGFAPTTGFVFGSQKDIRDIALANHWLLTRNVSDPEQAFYSRMYSTTHSNTLEYSFDINPVKNFRITFKANKTYANNLKQSLDVVYDDNSPITEFSEAAIQESGSFKMSYYMLGSSFDGDGSETFKLFKENRKIISGRLASSKGVNISGYGGTSQEVIIPALLSAYSGSSANDISLNAFRNTPIPNWNISYNGLMRIDWFKKNFKSFNISHGYSSSYTIANYTNNLLYDSHNKTDNLDVAGNYQSPLLIDRISLVEQFSPLARIDIRLLNNVSFNTSFKKERRIDLAFTNNSVTDTRSDELTFGFGYILKDVKMKTKISGKSKTLKGNIVFKLDLSFKNGIIYIRNLETDDEEVTAGEKTYKIDFTAKYSLTKNLNASLYFNLVNSKYAISTIFPRKSFSTGISFTYNFSK